MMPISLETSQQYCHELMRSAARNFYYGMSLLPAAKRQAMFALYTYMRQIDDLADDAVDAGLPRAVAEQHLEQWRQLTHAAIQGEDQGHIMLPAVRWALEEFAIPRQLLDDAIDGQLADLHHEHYHNFEELRHYCYCVASTVGIAAVYIWRYQDPQAITLADDRGVAFQLTNILRDLREDWARGRVYLPREDLDRFAVDMPSAMAGKQNDRFLDLMQFQIARAREYYEQSSPLENLIEPDARPTLRIMTQIYRGILERIAVDPLAVLTGKVSLSGFEKLGIVVRQVWLGQKQAIAGLP